MLRLSKMTDYAVIILAEMAHHEGAYLSAALLAQETKLPEPTVAKILKLLAKYSLVTSTRGTNGGYMICKTPSEINMGQVITATQGPIALTACVDTGSQCCDRVDDCNIKEQWNPVNAAMQSALEKVSLQQMMGSK